MLLLKPLSEDRGRSLVPMSQLLLSLRLQGYASQTCTHVRLLGPCFKTGRIEPFCQLLVTNAVRLASHIRRYRRSGIPRTQLVRLTCTRNTSSQCARITRGKKWRYVLEAACRPHQRKLLLSSNPAAYYQLDITATNIVCSILGEPP